MPSNPQLTPRPIFDATLQLLTELANISSPSGDIDGLQDANQCLAKALEQRGMTVEIRQEDTDLGPQPVLYARGPQANASGDDCLFLIGHLDTVLPALEARIETPHLVATGAIDMKGGLAAFVGAMDLVAERQQSLPTDLFLVVVPDEEVAGQLSHEMVTRYGTRCRGMWVLEPGRPGSEVRSPSTGEPADGAPTDRPHETMVLGRRGMMHWQLRVEGRGAHAGNAYWQGRSALTAAAEWCVGARALASPGRGPTVNAGRLVAGEIDFVDNLQANAHLIGTTRQINVVPNLAVVEGEARFLQEADGDHLIDAMGELSRRLADEHQVAMHFEVLSRVPALDPDGPGKAWAQRAVALAAERGWHLEIEQDRGGISFPNFLPNPSQVPVLDGLGPVGGGMHTRQEFLDLESFDRRITLLADLLAAEGGGQAD